MINEIGNAVGERTFYVPETNPRLYNAIADALSRSEYISLIDALPSPIGALADKPATCRC